MISIQRSDASDVDPDRSIMLNAKVVRAAEDGVGLNFVLLDKDDSQNSHANGAGRKTFRRFLERVRDNKGQALIEYGLILPFVFLLIINLVNFGGFFYAWITVANAARAGADYAIMAGASVGAPGKPSLANITSVITQDVYSLPNKASVSLNICQTYKGVVTTLSGTCTALSDPETNYTLMSIDVGYTYVPLLPISFQAFGVPATLPPTTIHQKAVMRLVQ